MSQEEMFSLAYSEYPKHVARKAAEKAWGRIEPNEATFTMILKAILIQKRTVWLGKELQYVPHFSTWLNGERWDDEVEYAEPESKAERVARENREGAIEFDKQLFGPTGDAPGRDD